MQFENFLRFQILDEHNASSFFICLEPSSLNSPTKVLKYRNNKPFTGKLLRLRGVYNFIPLLLFGCIGCRIDCRSLPYCSLNHWLRGIRFAVRVSRLSLSRRICKGVLSVANHLLCSEENSRPVKFTILPLISSANSIAESPICRARHSNLRRCAKSRCQRMSLIIELKM